MKIKKISLAISLAVLTNLSYAQEFPGLTEGKDYTKSIATNPAADTSQNKPALVEFFWYGCPHCYHVKDESSKIAKKYAAKINFVRYPVGFPNWESGGRMFFTFQEMKILDKMHDKTFDRIHKERVNILDNKNFRDEFLKSNNIDVTKFDSIYNSFGTSIKWNQSQTVTRNHGITGSPVFAVYSGGFTYQVSPAQAGGYDKALNNVDVILKTKTK
jgi:thiol:disulfide interchange protein DsbA